MNRVESILRSLTPHLGLVAVLAVLVAVFSMLSKNFFQASTVVSIANQIPDLTFLVVGMTLVLIIGGIDLSVGALLALASAVLGVLMDVHGWSIWLAFPIAILVSAAAGGINGAISVGFGIPSFIVTLGMLEMARGATKVVTESKSIYIGSRIEWFGQPIQGLAISPAFMVAIAAVVAGQLFLTRTIWGRYCIAIGTNAEAVRMSGIRSAPLCVSIFVLSGVMCGMAGLAQTSRLSSSDPNAAIGIELAAIAACVIGGTSLMGGRGNVIRSFIGVLIIQVLQTGLAQLGVSDASKQIITGLVIVVAVLLDALRTRWNDRT
ncbi:ABC transporter permease [Rhodopirellula halodulae]|uniref:ABC transporter permease n=1 Tax=Rhodopirellula halodulae TaxID=2894198 RepID=UPI001E4C925F|nr:ABC transporter permease [Rhodopirellula sp. JC737]MCC9658042.1 ABC transporter permease [Rhodopirellula sp. JC737]